MPAGFARRDRLRLLLADSSHPADRIEFTVAAQQGRRYYGLVVLSPLLSTRIAATQLRFNTARLFTAQKRTFTVLSTRHFRRTGTGHWPLPSGDPPDGTGEALFLPAETVAPSAPRSAEPGW